jgi:hypothetical protein
MYTSRIYQFSPIGLGGALASGTTPAAARSCLVFAMSTYITCPFSTYRVFASSSWKELSCIYIFDLDGYYVYIKGAISTDKVLFLIK